MIQWKDIYTIDKVARPEALLDIIEFEEMRDKEARIKEIWAHSEFNTWNDPHGVWDELISWYNQTPKDKKLIDKVFKGKPRVCYRGGHNGGRSWTLSKEKAEWFANRFKGIRDDWDHSLQQREIHPDNVAWIDNSRKEQEVVLIETE